MKFWNYPKLSIIWSTPLDMNVYVKDELHSSRIDSLILWVEAFLESAHNKKFIVKVMDAIKKKMQSLKSETDNALSRAEELDGEAKEATLRAEKYEETVSVYFIKYLVFS